MKIIRFAQALLSRHSWFVAIFQALLISVSLISAWLLRFDFSLPYRRVLLTALPILIVFRLAAITRFRLMHGWWKYTGISDALDIFKAIVLGSAAFIISVHYVLGMTRFPRSVYVLEPLITGTLLMGVRLCSRVLAESVRQDMTASKKVILIGAGIAAQTVARETKRLNSGFVVIGYVDDDRSKHRLKLHGIPVLGSVDALPKIVEEWTVDEVLIAVPSASGPQMQRFVNICEEAQVKFRTVPALRDIISGRVGVTEFRDVRVEDILGRDPVQIDLDAVRHVISGKTVVVTGAAGSIGSELCRQILEFSPAKLLCIDQNETGAFYLQRELLQHCDREKLIVCVADIGDSERMQGVFREHNPNIVFHAAAYKHVPVMESNVQSAVMNNVFGLLNFLEVVRDSNCEGFVLISSDKAVNPTNVMGATKRLCELIVASQPQDGPRCVSVRFGNVLFSSGSVVPVLQEQLRNNKPLTITHPDINRFFMTTGEAVSLVLQAFAIGSHKDTLVLDMGTPVRIVDLARTLIRLAGKTEQQVPIKFMGLRPGEKLSEELFYHTEEICPTSFAKIKRTRNVSTQSRDIASQLDELRSVLFLNGAATIRAKIKEIIPEYVYEDNGEQAESQTEKLAAAIGD